MYLKYRIKEALADGAKTNKELHSLIHDKSTRIISATISLNKDMFIRLDKAYVGLKGRDEHLISGNRIVADKFCLYKKLLNILVHQEKRLSEIYSLLPNEKKVSIRATVNMRPDLFVRVATGVIGKAGRDEHLIEKYRLAKASTKVPKIRKRTIAEKLTLILLDGEKSVSEIHHLMPTYPRKSITSKLTLHDKFEKVERGRWRLRKIPSIYK